MIMAATNCSALLGTDYIALDAVKLDQAGCKAYYNQQGKRDYVKVKVIQ